jgi:hypothetical protein
MIISCGNIINKSSVTFQKIKNTEILFFLKKESYGIINCSFAEF